MINIKMERRNVYQMARAPSEDSDQPEEHVQAALSLRWERT